MNKTKIIASINHSNYQNLQEMIVNGVDAVCLDSSISNRKFIRTVNKKQHTLK